MVILPCRAYSKTETIKFKDMELPTINHPTMTSIQVAELAGKRHKDVMRSIRNMESSWEKVCGRKFALTSKEVPQPNGGVRNEPCYELTGDECLYIASKFNDEVRARLVMKWRELEQGSRSRIDESRILKIESRLKTIESVLSAADIKSRILETSVTATQAAQMFGMSVRDFNRILKEEGIQYYEDGYWHLAKDMEAKTAKCLAVYVTPPNADYTFMKWTRCGIEFIAPFLTKEI